jgi:pimeloyl-ACP methyl ester carboxylesterase
MSIKNVQIDNDEVSYWDSVNSKGDHRKAILFIHGNSLNSNFFKFQFSSELTTKYRLVAIDLPGHGNSNYNIANNYSLPYFTSLIENFVITLELKNLIIVGHSLGGHLTTPLLAGKISPLIKGIFLFGAPPVGSASDFSKAFHPNEAASGFFQEKLSDKEISLMNNCLYKEDFIQDSGLSTSIKNTHPKIRVDIANSVMNNEVLNEVEILNQNKLKFKILVCPNDVLINGKYIFDLATKNKWQENIIIDQSSGHTPQVENPSFFNQTLKSFIEELNKNEIQGERVDSANFSLN